MRQSPGLPRSLALSAALAVLLPAGTAHAYRPFDGTDADTAELGDFELELGPAQYYRLGSQSSLVAPATVLNFGIYEGTELVIDVDQHIALGKLAGGTPRYSVVDDDVLIKHTFREGTLQGKTGVSIAAEFGILTPEFHGVPDTGASLDVITSYRWSFGSAHWNEWVEFTRDDHADLYTGLILEGPHEWRVRPVAELYYDKTFGEGDIESALVGAIWQARESFDLDVAVRAAREDGLAAAEVRLGFTWTVAMWEARERPKGPKETP